MIELFRTFCRWRQKTNNNKARRLKRRIETLKKRAMDYYRLGQRLGEDRK